MPDRLLPDWNAGDRWEKSRSHLNAMQRKIQEHEALLQDDTPVPQKLKFLRLKKDIPPSTAGSSGGTPLPEYTATVVNYDPTTGELDDAEELDNVISPFGEEYSEGDYVVAVGHNGKFVPITAKTEQLYQLTTPLRPGGTATARRMTWSSASGSRVVVPEMSSETVTEVTNRFCGETGEYVRCVKHATGSGVVLEVVDGPTEFWAVLDGVLTWNYSGTDWSPTALATRFCYYSNYYGGGPRFVNTYQQITVRELTRSCWGLPGDTVRVRIMPGTSGPTYFVVRGGQAEYFGTLTATLNCNSTATASVMQWDMEGGNRSASITVRDAFLGNYKSLPSGSGVRIVSTISVAPSRSLSPWYVVGRARKPGGYPTTEPPVVVVTDVRHNPTSGAPEIKTREIDVDDFGSESAWV